MPIACNTSALTGQDGAVFFEPAGTEFCLLDYTDFPAGTEITVPTDNDYQLGDPVAFYEEGTANLDGSLTASTEGAVTAYYVVAIAADRSTISVSATSGGTPVTLAGDGGTGSADTPGAANHIKIEYAEFAAICQVREFSLEISREELDVTTLPCGPQSASRFASFRKIQPSYASGTGSMTVYFTDDQTSLANRLISNVLLKDQQGAKVKLYVNAVYSGGSVDDTASMYVEAGIRITGMSMSANPDDPTTAELTFAIQNPKHILTTDIV